MADKTIKEPTRESIEEIKAEMLEIETEEWRRAGICPYCGSRISQSETLPLVRHSGDQD